jgi:hypothetical protein
MARDGVAVGDEGEQPAACALSDEVNARIAAQPVSVRTRIPY